MKPTPADLLPWAAILHCALGLWMHTYFRTTAQAALVSWLGVSGLTPSDLRELSFGLIAKRAIQVRGDDELGSQGVMMSWVLRGSKRAIMRGFREGSNTASRYLLAPGECVGMHTSLSLTLPPCFLHVPAGQRPAAAGSADCLHCDRHRRQVSGQLQLRARGCSCLGLPARSLHCRRSHARRVTCACCLLQDAVGWCGGRSH